MNNIDMIDKLAYTLGVLDVLSCKCDDDVQGVITVCGEFLRDIIDTMKDDRKNECS